MNTNTALSVVACLLSLASTSFSEQPEKPITDLKMQLAESSWRAVPISQTRPGLTANLTFSDETVAPAGYRYDVSASGRVTIHFNHGDTQAMELAPDGRHLQFTFRQTEFTYELIEGSDVRKELSGTLWKAINHLRPGLAANLTFSEDAIAPAGYRYDVNASDSITVHFNHGDTQLMLLAPDRKHFKFIFGKENYEYELASK
jgi:hypothetical protein